MRFLPQSPDWLVGGTAVGPDASQEEMMLRDYPVYPTIPTGDVDRLRPFYEDTLGFEAIEETRAGVGGLAERPTTHKASTTRVE